MWPVWVLLWMHCLMRKRRYFRTFFDYLSPIIFLLLIHFTTEPVKNYKHQDVHYTEPFHLGEGQVRVLFTPETKLTMLLMEQVGNKLNIKKLDHLPREKEKGFFPFSNATALSILDYSKDMNPNDAIVIFEDMESDTWPTRLNYTIRMKYSFMTYQYEPEDSSDLGSHEYFGTQYEPFMRLQWAIDSSYLSLLSGASIDQELTLQEFPYAAEHLNMRVVGTCMLAAMMLSLSLTLTFVFLAGRLWELKNSGVHELVKMAGVSWEALSLSHVLDVLPNLLVYVVSGAVFFTVAGHVPNTSGVFIAVALALHFLTVVALAFVVVYVFDMTQYLDLVSMAVYSAFWVASMLSQKLNGRALSLLCCLIPHDPLFRFWRALASREMFDDRITISNMWHYEATSHTQMMAVRVTVAEIYLFMILQVLLLSMLAWYLSRVRPGQFGQALPWKFPFSMDYWFVKPKVEAAPEEMQFAPETDQRYFEKAPAGVPVGIQINDVSKVFGKERVLHGVNMAVYKGEITVLLGHNGAGKTTLISIITGLISATSGRVQVEGMDTMKQAREVRKLIGLCPQQNIFFPLLTVLEHVMLFAMLKGQTYTQSKASAKELFAKLQLSDKANSLTSDLSGGMKRRAQLACAVAGGARVLVLDEPTSGLDVQTRRELWDLLLSLRGDHTVLLTTHFMEEADALGDRIAALHHGVLRCHATAMFLKRAIGTGYRLSLTTIGAPKQSAITAAITELVPSATVRDQCPGAISYNLPANDTAKFPQLFTTLEERRSELGVDTIGVGKSTLDEVFMELCSDSKETYSEESNTTTIEPVHKKVTGFELYARQFAVLLMRQWHYITSRLFGFLFTVALVILLVWLFTAVTNNNPFGVQAPPRANDPVAMSLELYAARTQRRVLVNVPEETLEALRSVQAGVSFETTRDVAQAILEIGRRDIQEYNKYLVGIELNETDAKALYTTTVRHAAPVSLNLLSNALASRLLGHADGRTITTRNHPLTGAYVPYAENVIKMPKQQQQIVQWASNIAMILLVYLCSFATLPCSERVSGARLAQLMAGCPAWLLWLATLAAQLAQAALVAVLPVVICAGAVDADHTINRPGFLLALTMVLLLGIVSFLGLVYFVTTLAGHSTVSFILPVAAFLFTLVTPLIPGNGGFYEKLLHLVYLVMPPHTLTVGLVKAAQVAQLNAYCDLNRDKCPALFAPSPFESSKCCDSPPGSDPWSYWAVNNDAAGWPMLLLAGQAVVYLVLTYLSELGVLERLHARVWARGARGAAPPRRADAVTRAETAYVEKAIQLPKEQITDAILCHNLQKNYPGCCRKKPFFAVKGISFSVKKGECFGLLGVNGAGKTTTFKMLTGDTCPTGGHVFANGHSLTEKSAYMHTLSYCPQFAGVDDFLTGRQNLALLLTLRGLTRDDVDAVSRSWLEEVALSQHADKRVSTYSGGCARRLAAAAALCQGARATLLDEPTAGCDPIARRRMHRALLRARDRALVVASHSLDEMEALCHRIAIMSGGELRALGSASALKAQHAAGYSVVFKLGTAQDVPDGVSQLDDFKGDLHSQFECTLQDQHQTMLSYHIKDTLRYSALFSGLERLRAQHPGLLHDYTVTETTLEQVFLAFAREEHDPQV